ncbi:MAG: CopD family protein [Pseudomonadota bacterium]|jgi:putative membrane protein|nr:CopD family protein [Pseudomonadota bacterium]
MSNGYLWIKALHIIFVTSWFAGLFYLPRIFVNLATVEDAATRDRLLIMARKLLRFTSGLAVFALAFGMWLLSYGVGIGAGWMNAKLALVLLVLAYHGWCASLYGKFVRGESSHSHVWFRYFNEVPVVLLAAIVILVVVKPF